MRTTHPSTLIYNQHNGIYLYGGWETIDYIHRDATSNAAGLNYRNLDVNCNREEGNYIVGLNQRTLPNDIPYANIIGTYLEAATDQIVSTQSANLNNRYTGISVNDVFVKDFSDAEYMSNISEFKTWHSDLAKQKTLNVSALDKPSNFNHAYEIYPNASYLKKGLFTKQSNGSTVDVDRYKVVLSRGITKIEVNTASNSYPDIKLYNPYQTNIGSSYAVSDNNSLVIANIYSGNYYFNFVGYSGNGWRSYNYNVYNKPASSLYANATTTCNQGSITFNQ